MPSSKEASSTRRHAALLAAVLEHFTKNPPTIAGSELFFDRDVVYIADSGIASGVSTRVLLRKRSQFVVKTDTELQAIADRIGASLEYLRFSQVEIAGDCAVFEVELSVMTPARSPDYQRRCWKTRDAFVKRNGTWKFELGTPQDCR